MKRRTAMAACLLGAGVFLGLGPAQAGVVVGPWLEGDTTTNVDVLVECDSAAVMTVNYGPTTNLGMSAVTSSCWTNSRSGSDFIHRITLAGLQPNTVYHYQLAGQGAGAADYNFETMPRTQLAVGITLAEAPVGVSNAVVAAANGRALGKINRVRHIEGPEFYAYIADTLGPQLLVMHSDGEVLINARVVPFVDLPPDIQQAAHGAVLGRLEVCRQASQATKAPYDLADSQNPYVIDYILNEDEPLFGLLRETDGWVRAVYGYYEDDPA